MSNNIVKYLMNIRHSISGSCDYLKASLAAQMVKNLLAMQETQVRPLCWEI